MNWFKHKIRQIVAGKELNELWWLRQRISEVGCWCSEDKKAVAISKYLLDMHDYPCQSRGAYGDISDFREYLKTLN